MCVVEGGRKSGAATGMGCSSGVGGWWGSQASNGFSIDYHPPKPSPAISSLLFLLPSLLGLNLICSLSLPLSLSFFSSLFFYIPLPLWFFIRLHVGWRLPDTSSQLPLFFFCPLLPLTSHCFSTLSSPVHRFNATQNWLLIILHQNIPMIQTHKRTLFLRLEPRWRHHPQGMWEDLLVPPSIHTDRGASVCAG